MMIKTQSLSQSAAQSIYDDLEFILWMASSQPCEVNGEQTEIASGVHRYYTGDLYPFFNGVIHQPESSLSLTSEDIHQHLNYFQDKAAPHIWWLTSSKQQEHYHHRLVDAGYAPMGVYQGYAVSHAELEVNTFPSLPKHINVQIHEVQDAADFKRFTDLLGEIFELPQPTKERFETIMGDFGPKKTYRHIYAIIDGKIVGVMSALFRNGWCSVWNGGVIQEERGKGIGRALCRAIYQLGVEENAQGYTGILMGDAQAQGLCQKFNASKVSELYPYIFGLSADDFEPH